MNGISSWTVPGLVFFSRLSSTRLESMKPYVHSITEIIEPKLEEKLQKFSKKIFKKKFPKISKIIFPPFAKIYITLCKKKYMSNSSLRWTSVTCPIFSVNIIRVAMIILPYYIKFHENQSSPFKFQPNFTNNSQILVELTKACDILWLSMSIFYEFHWSTSVFHLNFMKNWQFSFVHTKLCKVFRLCTS